MSGPLPHKLPNRRAAARGADRLSRCSPRSGHQPGAMLGMIAGERDELVEEFGSCLSWKTPGNGLVSLPETSVQPPAHASRNFGRTLFAAIASRKEHL